MTQPGKYGEKKRRVGSNIDRSLRRQNGWYSRKRWPRNRSKGLGGNSEKRKNVLVWETGGLLKGRKVDGVYKETENWKQGMRYG